MHILNFTTLVVLIAMHCAFISGHPSPTDLRDNDPIAIESQLYPAGNDSLTVEEALHLAVEEALQGNHLAARQFAIDMLPIPAECKIIFKNVIPVSKKAFAWIKKTVCEDYKCKVKFAPTYKKYSINPIKKDIIMNWIFGTFEKKGHPISKVGINPSKIFDSIVKKCIEEDKEIMGIQNVCASSQDKFKEVKGCVIGEVMPYVGKAGSWAGKACKIARDEKLVEKIVKPVFTPNWRKLVSGFKNDKLCGK
ncbi:unnamed protein product [Penicillium camemberti]|uniref:Str. FM013 n=1 Tax=Penicillium camemberti (strain FM 013) TaxID=1429867 RepID=A0A0G4PPS7_PENC3|nr:unnamed protein product [Penicillium camemberti]